MKFTLGIVLFIINSNGKDFFNERFKKIIPQIFVKYTNYSYKERLFLETKAMDQYKNMHLFPYYLSLITLPDKTYSQEDIIRNPNFWDCNLRTLDEIAHYTRCFPFSFEGKDDIWTSPDFLLKIRKGGVDDHAILMACLMMGLKKVKKQTRYFKMDETTAGNTIDGDTTKGNSTTTGNTTMETPVISLVDTKVVFPYENKVFICLGKLRYKRQPHIWVMTLSDDYRDVTFWEPKLFYKFDLRGRIDEPETLKLFLEG